MQINVIHLRKENFEPGTKQYNAALLREKNIEHQRATHSLDIKIWDGIITTPVHKAICIMHKRIVADAKERGLPMVTIAEDDWQFTEKGAWEYYQKELTPDADIFLGMIYSGEIEDGKIINGWSGLTIYTVFEKFYDTFLAVPDDRNLDRCLGQQSWENNYRVAPEFVAEQLNGYTYHLNRESTYNHFLLDRKLFGREINSGLKQD